MFAVIAAILFACSELLHLTGGSGLFLDWASFLTLGLLFIALHLVVPISFGPWRRA